MLTIVIIAESETDLQTLQNTMCDTGEQFELTINIKKTKTMVISKRGKVITKIQIKNEDIEQVDKIKYLGVWITEDLNPKSEIRSRIEQSRASFLKMKKFLC
ncbi:unnamed protein product, partial [Diabrotica balteata]